MKLSFVIPIHNERDTLATLAEGIREHTSGLDIGVLFVDDGSTDGSAEVLQDLADSHDWIEVIAFRRNLGKSAALEAGFTRVDADIVFTMDGDLQDDPKEIPRFLEKLNEGYDVVCGWKAVRHDPWHKTVPSRLYNKFVVRIFGLPIHDVNCGYKALRGEVTKRIKVYGEMHRLVPILATHMGYRVTEIAVEHHPRRFGKSKYGFERFSRGALDVLSLWFLDRHTHSPGHFFGRLGFMQWGLGVLFVVGALALGFTGVSLTLTILAAALAAALFAGGTALIGLGLIGELIVLNLIQTDLSDYIQE